MGTGLNWEAVLFLDVSDIYTSDRRVVLPINVLPLMYSFLMISLVCYKT